MISKKVKMKKICCIICSENRKLRNVKISYIFDKTFYLSIICNKCGSMDKIIFK